VTRVYHLTAHHTIQFKKSLPAMEVIDNHGAWIDFSNFFEPIAISDFYSRFTNPSRHRDDYRKKWSLEPPCIRGKRICPSQVQWNFSL